MSTDNETDHMSGPDGCHQDCPACAEEPSAELANIKPHLATKLHVTRCLHVQVPNTINGNTFEHILYTHTPGNDMHYLKAGITIPTESVQEVLDDMESFSIDPHADIQEFLLAALQYAQVHEAEEFLFHP